MIKLVENIDNLINEINQIENELNTIKDSKLQNEKFYSEIPTTISNLKNQIESWKDNEFSSQLLALVNNILKTYTNDFNKQLKGYHHDLLNKYNNIYNLLLELKDETKRVKYLSIIKEKNVLLMGGNGAGKSSFASYLKDSLSDNIVVIPAQKFLVFNVHVDDLHLLNKEDVKSIQNENFIRRGRFEENDQGSRHKVRIYTNDLSELFSKFITILVNEQVREEHNIINKNNREVGLEEDKEKTILHKLNKLWGNLIPDIEFKINTTNRTLIPVKEGKSYELNSMSDGEKAMLYYIIYVLLAEQDSFIVVDEPETFLNASNYNRLWDTLETERPDCKFIYISHVVDFIVTRTNSDLLWCKKYEYPDNWIIESIEAKDEMTGEFPRELLSELLGARKPILFCEGQKSSLDYTIYSSLFRNEAIVYPVGGHRNVIQYTRSYNKLSRDFNGNHAIGIIDSDLMTAEQITIYAEEKIYTLNFNEIEMLLLTEEVVSDVLQHFNNEEEIIEKINTFKLKFISTISKRTEKIITERIKKYIDDELSNYRINKSESAEQMLNEVENWISDLEVMEEALNFEEEIRKLLEEENYQELLKICPLKDEITKGIANNYLDNKYKDKALKRIKNNEELSNNIRHTYFSDLIIE